MSKQKPDKNNGTGINRPPSLSKMLSGQKPPPLPGRPRFRDIKRELDKAPKASPFQDKLLVWAIIFVIVAGIFFLLLGFVSGGTSTFGTPTPTKASQVVDMLRVLLLNFI